MPLRYLAEWFLAPPGTVVVVISRAQVKMSNIQMVGARCLPGSAPGAGASRGLTDEWEQYVCESGSTTRLCSDLFFLLPAEHTALPLNHILSFFSARSKTEGGWCVVTQHTHKSVLCD